MSICWPWPCIAGCKTRSATKRQRRNRGNPTDSLAAVKAAQALPEEPFFDIVTNMGTIRVRLFKDTPRHRDNFETLALSGYYDSLLFHRVINGFMIQGGDPFTRDTAMVEHYGEGGPAYTIPAEMRADGGNRSIGTKKEPWPPPGAETWPTRSRRVRARSSTWSRTRTTAPIWTASTPSLEKP